MITHFVLCLLTVFSVVLSSTPSPNTETCIAPLLEDDPLMCHQMDAFTQCYLDTVVSRDDSKSLYLSLLAMSEIMHRFKEERCDLNAEFNNECPSDFVDCLDKVTTLEEDKVHIDCREASFDQFLTCTGRVLPGASEPCYFSEWQRLIVKRTRALVCTSSTSAITPPSEPADDLDDAVAGQSGGGVSKPTSSSAVSLEISEESLGISSGSCEAGGIRYHVYNDCTVFRAEWIAEGVVFSPQRVVPGTRFDISICGQNQGSLVAC